MTPDAFSGLWRRRSLQLGDRAASEPASVHWIQWGDQYLDVRISNGGPRPFCGPGTFGGTTSWSDPVLTWHHALDSQPGAAADEGVVRWLDDDLIEERGVAVLDGADVVYVEVWERVGPRPTSGRHWSPAEGALIVEAGPHRMAGVVRPGGRWAASRSEHLLGDGWHVAEVVGHVDLVGVLRSDLVDPR